MKLIIVESPTKARTITRYLGDSYVVMATTGHIRDLPKGKLGVEVESNFAPEYVLVEGKKKVVDELVKKAKSADGVFLATDPDREGEAIAFHAAQLIGEKIKGIDKKISRISFHEITKRAIEEAIAHQGAVNLPLVNAQQARRVLDRLVGYKLSPLLWQKIRRGLSAGRVQSVALRLLVEREREIEKFIPVEYWEILCELVKKIGGQKDGAPSFTAQLTKVNGKPARVSRDFEASSIVAELEKAAFGVEEVDRKETKHTPPPPFITSTLQRQGFQKLGFSARRTMRAAQGLYEKGLITYHRTDSVALSQEALRIIHAYLSQQYPQEVADHPRQYKTHSKLAQEAHEAIRPTRFQSPVLEKTSRPDEGKLYELIFKRAVASQMKPAIFDVTKILVRAEGKENVYDLTAQGRINKYIGWLALYQGNGKQKTPLEEGDVLPPVEKGDELLLQKVDSQQKFTQPPPRYNEASLIKALETKGIGRPSTYAPTISTIQARQYVEKEERSLKPTSLGMTVSDFLVEYFPDVVDYDFTARMEDELDEIARGEIEWVKAVGEFYEPFIQKVKSVAKVAERVKVPVEPTDQKCPKCTEGQLVIRVGRFGKFLSCSRFPDCDYKAPYVEAVEGFKCPECGGEIVLRRTKKGRQFYGCSNWPKCDWASWRKPTKKNPPRKREKKAKKETNAVKAK